MWIWKYDVLVNLPGESTQTVPPAKTNLPAPDRPYVYGATPLKERLRILSEFRHSPDLKTLFISKIGVQADFGVRPPPVVPQAEWETQNPDGWRVEGVRPPPPVPFFWRWEVPLSCFIFPMSNFWSQAPWGGWWGEPLSSASLLVQPR